MPPGHKRYEIDKANASARRRATTAAGQDIGDIPPVRDSDRKARAMRDFRFFCEAYFPMRFPLAWAPDHFKAIAKIETATTRGGKFAFAMPRGFGKTTLCEVASLWALLDGIHKWVFLIGSIEDHAKRMLRNLKSELSHNDRLLEDFPEVVYPIRQLAGESRRCIGQLHHGRNTLISWQENTIRLPTIPGSRASGAIVQVAGLTGNIRGGLESLPSGESVRPSLVVLDDPQTDESARSPTQCEHREGLITGAIVNLAGPGRKISAFMPCTVIREGDLADTMLDTAKHPEWQGERTKLVYAWPKNTARWDAYTKLRREGLAAGDDGQAATAYYAKHRAAMDAGGRVAWEARRNDDELSALQHAMNLRIDLKDRAFFAEYQNEPLRDEQTADELTAADIQKRTNGFNRGLVPGDATILTMFIDVQKKALYWLVAAWREDFTGYVIDYGTEPDQKSAYFSLRDIRHTLAVAAPRAGMEGAIYAGLERLTAATVGREWKRDDGAIMRIDRCLIDAKWGESTAVIDRFCRTTVHGAVVMPYQGRGVGPHMVPFSEYRRKTGDRVGHDWRVPAPTGRREVRHVTADTNSWKSFTYARFAVAPGDPGALTLYGRDLVRHRMLAEHVTAERREATTGRGRKVDVWTLHPGRDNHLLDCLVGAAIGASMHGASVLGETPKRERARASWSDMQRRKRAEHAGR